MFLKPLINPKPSIIFFFIVFCVLFSLLPLIKFEAGVVFYHTYLHHFVVIILAVIAPFFLSTGLNNMVYEKSIIQKENLVIGVVFILASSPFINTVVAWLASFLLLFLFNFLMQSYQKELPFAQFYNASMILAGLTFIYPNLILLSFLLIISGINFNNLSWRIIFTILLGFITPYVFYFVFSVLLDVDFLLPKFFTFSKINFSFFQKASLSIILWGSILMTTILFSFIELFLWLYKKSIKSRRAFMTIIWFFIICFLIAIYSGWHYFYFSIIPLAIIIGNYFVYTKKRTIANILFALLLISSIYIKCMIVFNV